MDGSVEIVDRIFFRNNHRFPGGLEGRQMHDAFIPLFHGFKKETILEDIALYKLTFRKDVFPASR